MIAGLALPQTIAPTTEIVLETKDLENKQTNLQNSLNKVNDEILGLQSSRDAKQDKLWDAEMVIDTGDGEQEAKPLNENERFNLESEIDDENRKISQLEQEKETTAQELKNTIQKIQEKKKLPALTPEELTKTIEDLEKAHKTEKEQLEETLKEEKARQQEKLKRDKAARKAKQTGDQSLLSLRDLLLSKQLTSQTQNKKSSELLPKAPKN